MPIRNMCFRVAPSDCEVGLQQEVLLEHTLQLFRARNGAIQRSDAASHSSGTNKEAAQSLQQRLAQLRETAIRN